MVLASPSSHEGQTLLRDASPLVPSSWFGYCGRMELRSLIRHRVEMARRLLVILLMMGTGACSKVYAVRGGYSHPVSEKAPAAMQLDLGLGYGIADDGGIGAHSTWLRSKIGPGLFHSGLYPALLLNLSANKQISFTLNTGFEAAGVDVVGDKASFSIASPFIDLGIGYRPQASSHWLMNLAFGADYQVRTREDVPNAGYLNLTLGFFYAETGRVPEFR